MSRRRAEAEDAAVSSREVDVSTLVRQPLRDDAHGWTEDGEEPVTGVTSAEPQREEPRLLRLWKEMLKFLLSCRRSPPSLDYLLGARHLRRTPARSGRLAYSQAIMSAAPITSISPQQLV